jgi:hypothetical protein
MQQAMRSNFDMLRPCEPQLWRLPDEVPADEAQS